MKNVENHEYIYEFLTRMLTLKKLSANQIFFLGIIFPDYRTFFSSVRQRLKVTILYAV